MAKILGIDLGTTNSAMAVIEAGEPTIIENAEGTRTTPSIVAISKTKERLVGQIAKRQAVTNPTNTIYGIKRFMGHNYDDKSVQKDLEIVPYEIKKGSDGGAVVVLNGEEKRPEEVSAMILTKLKQDAEAKLGEKITEAVITVPAYFNDSQRKATQDAGKIAGLEVKRIINEPTAAALAYGFNKKKDEKIVVYDFGGGTFDVTVLEVGDDVVEVQATDGDAHMGGRDIDQGIVRFLIDEFKKSEGVDLAKDKLALQRLDEAAEKAKLELSSTTETDINIPFVSQGSDGPLHMDIKLTRAKLEEIAHEYVDKSIEITKRALEASGIKKDEIDEVILVGGQTRMPLVQQKVSEFFGKELKKDVNPDEAVAYGAKIVSINGNFDQALNLVKEISEQQEDIELVNSINPNRIHGQKTGAFEIVDELGYAPDEVFIPVGNAGNITAYWDGFKIYNDLNTSNLPKMIGFQAKNSAPIVNKKIIENPETVATAIRIGNPASWEFAEKALHESSGKIDAIDDDSIVEGYKIIASMEGIFAEPASCITVAGLYYLKKLGYDFSGKTIVCILTGNGLKDPDFANNYLNFQIHKMNPELEELKNFLLS